MAYFIELDKAVVLVWLDWLVFCEYGFSVSALWCPLTIPTIFLGFLLPWAWGISSRLFQQSAAAAPYLGWGVSPPTAIPDLQYGMAPLGPPAPTQPPLLGRGVAPPSRRKFLAFTRWTFVSKVVSLFFNTLSTFVIAFLPRSKHLLISWLKLKRNYLGSS